ncbi:MAG: hypothetical protein AB7S26_30565 [Sandaracinaceae bacterium]
MSAGLPASDRVVAALFARGLASSAIEFARAAIERGDEASERLSAQLDALRAGSPIEAGGTLPELDLGLASSLVDRYRYAEARSVLYALRERDTAPGRALAQLLDAALAPATETLVEVVTQVRRARAPEARVELERRLSEEETSEPELAYHASLCALMEGEWRQAVSPVPAAARDSVLALLRGRHLVGALRAAEAAGERELAERLARLVAVTEAETERIEADEESQRTLPMEGHGVAAFQLRMGQLTPADAAYRRIVVDEPTDLRAREILADIIAVRRALGEAVEPMPPRAASVHWLDKRRAATRAHGSGWGRGETSSALSAWNDESGMSTDVLDVAQQAELLLKVGKGREALTVYRNLAIRNPNSSAYRVRVQEIEAMLGRSDVPGIVEVTARHDLGELIKKSAADGVSRRGPIDEMATLDDDATSVSGKRDD